MRIKYKDFIIQFTAFHISAEEGIRFYALDELVIGINMSENKIKDKAILKGFCELSNKIKDLIVSKNTNVTLDLLEEIPLLANVNELYVREYSNIRITNDFADSSNEQIDLVIYEALFSNQEKVKRINEYQIDYYILNDGQERKELVTYDTIDVDIIQENPTNIIKRDYQKYIIAPSHFEIYSLCIPLYEAEYFAELSLYRTNEKHTTFEIFYKSFQEELKRNKYYIYDSDKAQLLLKETKDNNNILKKLFGRR